MRKFLTSLGIVICFLLLLAFVQVPPVFANQPVAESIEATITKATEESKIIPQGAAEKLLYQKLEMVVTRGSFKGKTITVENGMFPMAHVQKYQVGDALVLTHGTDMEGNDAFFIADSVRRTPLVILFILFLIVTVLVGKWRGITSLLGLALSFVLIFTFVLPQIAGGANPLLIAIAASLVLVPLTFYLSHGFNKKTSIAVVGTILTLIATGILAAIFVEAAKLTGFASEEAAYLETYRQGAINIKGLLLAGIIIGAVGILDDVTVSQSAIVAELRSSVKNITRSELYRRAMNIGRDHIASIVNTLILVYTGAAMPLLLLFVNNPRPFAEIINYEFMAEEILRTLVASIGLIIAVPITTFLAAVVFHEEKDAS